MGNTSKGIKIDPVKTESAISLLGNLTERAQELNVKKDKVEGDSGETKEAMEAYDTAIDETVKLLKMLISYTQRFLQKASDIFIDADEKIAKGIK